MYQNFKTLGFADILDRWCTPCQLMTENTLSGATTECLDTSSCDMFFDDGGKGNRFFSCKNTASIQETTHGSILYQKDGNKVHV